MKKKKKTEKRALQKDMRKILQVMEIDFSDLLDLKMYTLNKYSLLYINYILIKLLTTTKK